MGYGVLEPGVDISVDAVNGGWTLLGVFLLSKIIKDLFWNSNHKQALLPANTFSLSLLGTVSSYGKY